MNALSHGKRGRARHFPRVGTLIISRFFDDLKKMAVDDRLKNGNSVKMYIQKSPNILYLSLLYNQFLRLV